MSRRDDGFPFFWIMLIAGSFGGGTCAINAETTPSKPVAAEVVVQSSEPDITLETENISCENNMCWNPDSVTDADELFKDTFANVKDPFE